MAYNQNIPEATDKQSQSQPIIKANFQALKTLIDINHGTFGAADEGKHKWVTCPVQSSAPSFEAGEVGIYNLLYATTNKNELYVNKQSISGPVRVPITASILGTSTPASGGDGWSMLPSGVIVRWEGGLHGSGEVTVTLSGSGFPVFTTIYTVQLTLTSSSSADVDVAVRLMSIVSNTKFKIYFSKRTSIGAASGTCRALIIGV